MVIYDLYCDLGHQFEGWFKNQSDMVSQQDEGLLTCPYCNSLQVSKKVTAAKVGRKSNTQNVASKIDIATNKNSMITGDTSTQKFAELQGMLGKVHDYVDKNFENVGNRFAEEAISMHRGEKDQENIRGTVSREQIKELKEEGVQALPLPPKPIDKKKLN